MVGKKLGTTLAILAVAGLGAFAAGCGDSNSDQVQDALDNVNKQMEEANQNAQEALDNANKQLEQANQNAQEQLDQAQKNLNEAGGQQQVDEAQKQLDDIQKQVEDAMNGQ